MYAKLAGILAVLLLFTACSDSITDYPSPDEKERQFINQLFDVTLPESTVIKSKTIEPFVFKPILADFDINVEELQEKDWLEYEAEHIVISLIVDTEDVDSMLSGTYELLDIDHYYYETDFYDMPFETADFKKKDVERHYELFDVASKEVTLKNGEAFDLLTRRPIAILILKPKKEKTTIVMSTYFTENDSVE